MTKPEIINIRYKVGFKVGYGLGRAFISRGLVLTLLLISYIMLAYQLGNVK